MSYAILSLFILLLSLLILKTVPSNEAAKSAVNAVCRLIQLHTYISQGLWLLLKAVVMKLSREKFMARYLLLSTHDVRDDT